MKRYLMTVALLTVVCALAAGLCYDRLPERTAIHFNLDGEADGFASRARSVQHIVGVVPALSLLFLVVIAVTLPLERRFGRGEAHVERNMPHLYNVGIATTVLWALLSFMMLQSALTGVGPSMQTLFIALGGMQVLFGLMAGKLRSNHFFGIRTPWTLRSEAVWHRTHRMGGWALVAGGVLTMMAVVVLPTPLGSRACLAIMLASPLLPCVYSFVIRERPPA